MWKSAFCIRYGHYKYTVIPFGLVNAPMASQGHINNVSRKDLDQFCIAYLDDNVVHSNSLEEHREHVWLVIAELQGAGLYLKLRKCEFEMEWISLVSFIVTPEGVKMEPDRVVTIAWWQEPTSYCNIQVFICLANFYR